MERIVQLVQTGKNVICPEPGKVIKGLVRGYADHANDLGLTGGIEPAKPEEPFIGFGEINFYGRIRQIKTKEDVTIGFLRRNERFRSLDIKIGGGEKIQISLRLVAFFAIEFAALELISRYRSVKNSKVG